MPTLDGEKINFPDKVSRIYLKRYPASDEDSDYLSAVYVDGIRHQNQYLATQLPMPSTVNDFWRMVAEFKVELILMLQPPDLQDPVQIFYIFLRINFMNIYLQNIYCLFFTFNLVRDIMRDRESR